MSGTLREVRQLGQAAAAADDAAITRLVAMLDALPRRGEADRILDSVRPRLRMLQLARPLGFPRLLFLPLDGAILPATRWNRAAPCIPRSALLPIAAVVQAGLGEEGAAIAAGCAGHAVTEPDVVAALGQRLWPRAGQVLPAAPPPGWEGTGLAAADYAPIAALCRPLWEAGPAIWAAQSAAVAGPPEDLARAALAAVAPAGPGPLSATLATLLLQAAAPGLVAQVAARLDPAARTVAVQALDALLEQPAPAFDSLDALAAAEQAAALARRLDDLQGCALLAGDRQRRLQAIRHAADEACRAGFLVAAERQVVAPATRLADAPMVTDAEVEALEDGARQLRALEGAGRRLGGGTAYDRAIRDLTTGLATLGGRTGPEGGLSRVDLARSIEILAGPEAAAALLSAAGGR
ncbi:hypothetical protein [Paracraurococcus lichenis]|uniref:Uncharacterized protein n=1 Tax=Paracraurococcus lichenis TaxID=3064888 RepID=A0ABT9DY28_9PROT|nr:hypothetical protein [Paracraurococcus sp. LOR1-02]MDO9708784.1 hypothetical protein [Paracraurococcus sp. LOR1-02]